MSVTFRYFPLQNLHIGNSIQLATEYSTSATRKKKNSKSEGAKTRVHTSFVNPPECNCRRAAAGHRATRSRPPPTIATQPRSAWMCPCPRPPRGWFTREARRRLKRADRGRGADRLNFAVLLSQAGERVTRRLFLVDRSCYIRGAEAAHARFLMPTPHSLNPPKKARARSPKLAATRSTKD